MQSEIKKQINFFDADAGAGVVLNIQNGEILGLSSFPSFDVNYFGEASKERFLIGQHLPVMIWVPHLN